MSGVIIPVMDEFMKRVVVHSVSNGKNQLWVDPSLPMEEWESSCIRVKVSIDYFDGRPDYRSIQHVQKELLADDPGAIEMVLDYVVEEVLREIPLRPKSAEVYKGGE